MITPALLATMFFWSTLQVAFMARMKHVGAAMGGGDGFVWVELGSPSDRYVDRSAVEPMLSSVPLMTRENTVNAVSG